MGTMSDPVRIAPEDLKAKDLVRLREIEVRPWLGHNTQARLWGRFSRRPAGNTARLWKKMGEEDPFAAPSDGPPEHRTVYVAGRFVRIDHADKEAAKAAKAKNPHAAGPTRPKAPEDGAKAASKLPPKAPPSANKGPERIGAYQIGSNVPNPLGLRKKGEKAPTAASKRPPPAGFDRTPPLIASQSTSSMSAAGRYRPVTQQVSRRPTIGEAPPPGGQLGIVNNGPAADKGSGLFARPGSQGARPGAPAGKAPAPQAKAPAPAAKAPPPRPPTPQTPPAKAPVQQAKPPAPMATPVPKAAPQMMAKAPAPSAPSPAPKPAAAPMAKAADTKAAEPPVTAVPAGAVNIPGPAQSVPKRRPTVVEPLRPEPAPAQAPTSSPPANRAPPVLGGGGGGMDDLFGGAAQEGRVRIGRVKKDPPKTE